MSIKNDAGNIPSLFHLFVVLVIMLAILMMAVFVALELLAMLL